MTRYKIFLLIIASGSFLLIFPSVLFLNNTTLQPAQPTRELAKLSLPWYFSNGSKHPPSSSNLSILNVWPKDSRGDRILDQLMLNPPLDSSTVKKIYIPPGSFDVSSKTNYFAENCVVNQCDFVTNPEFADAVIFKDFAPKRDENSQRQIWILYVLESPYVSGREVLSGSVNWTATYRHDSDIVTPYEKWVYYDEEVHWNPNHTENHAEGKTKSVAWFVSNCRASNGRLEYARELQRYIAVDIFGACGSLKCTNRNDCFKMLQRDYKFYLAFENSNCRDYITEKFFVNALQNNVIPIAMGAHPNDYKAVAPERSYIHVDEFQSPYELAQYLKILEKDDQLYSSYFRWKKTGEFINTRFFCRLCAMLHTSPREKHYPNFRKWWAGAQNEVCRAGSWIH